MTRRAKRNSVIGAILFLITGIAAAQSPDEVVDMKRIPKKAVRNLVRKENVKTANDFQNIATSCYRAEDSARYQTNLKTYVVKEPIGKVWEQLTKNSIRYFIKNLSVNSMRIFFAKSRQICNLDNFQGV
ncbi:MAG: hypothetical protein NTV01_22355 [Bacteroidia bacterium]|nr:hypothetical protein [Bacteroidia bacterium]